MAKGNIHGIGIDIMQRQAANYDNVMSEANGVYASIKQTPKVVKLFNTNKELHGQAEDHEILAHAAHENGNYAQAAGHLQDHADVLNKLFDNTRKVMGQNHPLTQVYMDGLMTANSLVRHHYVPSVVEQHAKGSSVGQQFRSVGDRIRDTHPDWKGE